jgi:helicase
MGVDLPAFRTVIRDLARYSQRGMQGIHVLEYEQMAGRAGRPGKEDYGEAICIAQSKEEARAIREKYLEGTPEEIDSKLAVEPVLRTYVLSLIASGFVHDSKSLEAFFAKTFYAHQYKDLAGLMRMLSRVVKQLQDWEFLKDSERGFVSANKLKDEQLEATPVGARVAQLYLDPLTARQLIDGMRRSTAVQAIPFTWLHLLASQLEMRPLLSVRVAEYDVVNELVLEHEESFLSLPPSEFEEEYDEFLQSVKTAKFLHDWIDERTEEQLLEDYNVRPGELHGKLAIADWLCYSMEELAKVLHLRIKDIAVVRVRLQYGARDELLPLLRLKNVGRMRARKMFFSGIKTIADVKEADLTKLSQILGKAVALDVKKQVGQNLSDEKIVVKPGKRKGQHSLEDY